MKTRSVSTFKYNFRASGIPAGKPRGHSDVARDLGAPEAVRAVAAVEFAA